MDISDIIDSLPERIERPTRKSEYYAEWYQRNKIQQAKYYAGYREKIKFECVEAYGGSCIECGVNDPIVLVIDHTRDNAKEDREILNQRGGYKLYMDLKRRGWPKNGYQLLCHNCNFRKEYIRRKCAVYNR